jgi:hypothetical protein
MVKCKTMNKRINLYLNIGQQIMPQCVRYWVCLCIILGQMGVYAQDPLSPSRPHSIQSDTLLQALERALFPPDVTLIRIRDYPDCWRYEMKIDTNRLVRLPQPDHREVGALLRQIAFSRDYRYFEPVMAMYLRHQDYFKKEWEEVHSKYKYNCDERINQVSIMLTMEHALRALEFAHRQISAEELWAYYDRQRDLDFHISKGIGLYSEITQAYEFYSEYFREVRRMRYSWFAYEASVQPYSPFIDMLESYIVQECLLFEPSDIIGSLEDTLKGRNLMYFSRNMNTMSQVSSPSFESCIQKRFELFINTDKSSSLVELLQYAQRNPHISENYVVFMLDQLFYHEKFSDWGYVGKENWYKIMLHRHTRQHIKPYLLEKANSTQPSDRVLAYAFLVQFPEEDVLELFLSRARSRHTTEEEMEVLYNNFKRINQRIYFRDAQHDEVRKQIKRMAPNCEKNER